MLRALKLAAVTWLLLLAALGARGESNDASARAYAQQQFQRGKALYQSKDYEAALAAFRAGFQRYPLRGFLVNIGQCHRRLDQLEEAAAAYRHFLAGEGVAPALRREVEDALVEVESHLPARHVPPPSEAPSPPRTPVIVEPVPDAPTAVARPSLIEEAPAAAPPLARRRRWLWPVVGTSIGLVVAGAITAGVVLGSRDASAAPSGGSLGLLDGRTR